MPEPIETGYYRRREDGRTFWVSGVRTLQPSGLELVTYEAHGAPAGTGEAELREDFEAYVEGTDWPRWERCHEDKAKARALTATGGL